MISDLVSTSTMGLLERTINFTEQRHQILLENLANVDTPGYVQKDVSVREFQQSLAAAVEKRRQSFNGIINPESTDTVEFESGSSRLSLRPQNVVRSSPFHDRGIRSMEDLMVQMADNGQAHNLAVSMLKGKYDQIQRAISLKV